jgi:hypothetical protein
VKKRSKLRFYNQQLPVETLLATSPAQFPKDKIMVEELEKEYAVLKDKVRELREYL